MTVSIVSFVRSKSVHSRRYIRVEVGRELVLFAKGDYVKRIRDDRNKKGNAAMESDQGLDAPSFFACILSRAVIIVDIDNFR